jgi:hypothetical protein
MPRPPRGCQVGPFLPGYILSRRQFLVPFFPTKPLFAFPGAKLGRHGRIAHEYTDIAIIGGGLAGSTAAAMLGRADIPTILIDPHQAYPFDFRVEKISGDEQIGRFYQTGITRFGASLGHP